MFTGIVRGTYPIHTLQRSPGRIHLGISLDPTLITNLQIGASISIDGVCLTVVKYDHTTVWFDVIQETLQRTTLQYLEQGQLVNVERAARFGDEIGGHLLSGHVFGTVKIHSINRANNNCVVFLQCLPVWTKYLLPKGYVALNGASLTIVDVDRSQGLFSVHLIPETLQKTTFSSKKVGDYINIELDAQTQAIVDTVERLYQDHASISTNS